MEVLNQPALALSDGERAELAAMCRSNNSPIELETAVIGDSKWQVPSWITLIVIITIVSGAKLVVTYGCGNENKERSDVPQHSGDT